MITFKYGVKTLKAERLCLRPSYDITNGYREIFYSLLMESNVISKMEVNHYTTSRCTKKS